MAKNLTVVHIEHMFSGLKSVRALPSPGTLSTKLSTIVDTSNGSTTTIDKATLSCFGTAAIEMWHRSLHSFFISASLTKASPLWSSVAGYYSSHYAMRAFAHLLGYFQLFSKRRVIEVNATSRICNIKKKDKDDREHQFYWRIVKENQIFSGDPFFVLNLDRTPVQKKHGSTIFSDVGHRSKANYYDHINGFPEFQVLDSAYMKSRINLISSITLSDAPLPKVESYPDLDSVQLIAYHRMIKFRLFLDQILGGSNQYWTNERKPSWCPPFFDFQVSQPEYSTIYQSIV